MLEYVDEEVTLQREGDLYEAEEELRDDDDNPWKEFIDDSI